MAVPRTFWAYRPAFFGCGLIVLSFATLAWWGLNSIFSAAERLVPISRVPSPSGRLDAVVYADWLLPIDPPVYEVSVVGHGEPIDRGRWVVRLGCLEDRSRNPRLEASWISDRALTVRYSDANLYFKKDAIRPTGWFSPEVNVAVTQASGASKATSSSKVTHARIRS